MAHCREGYADAEGVLAHLENVGELLDPPGVQNRCPNPT